METNRLQKINRLLQKEFGEIFLEYNRSLSKVMISVTNVHVSPDLGIVHVNLSIFPSEKSNDIISDIELNAKKIRFQLGNRVRHQLRIIPEIVYHIDETLDYLERIDNLLKK